MASQPAVGHLGCLYRPTAALPTLDKMQGTMDFDVYRSELFSEFAFNKIININIHIRICF
jgi:hypothetical protein